VKISIITACYNNEKTIAASMQSVANQVGVHLEHIIVDGLSTDKTLDIVSSYSHSIKVISEKDTGIYDALNKGVAAATGDIVGFLHSDDVFYANDVLQNIQNFFIQSADLEGIYGDIQFVNQEGKIIRHYSSKNFKFSDFARGKMPAHTSFFARKTVYEDFQFDLSYSIAADFDQMLRVFKSNSYTIQYRPIRTTTMLTGGASTKNIQARLTLNREIMQSCKQNGIKMNAFKVYSKYFTKILEFKF